MSLPYRWHADGTDSRSGRPTVGWLVAYNHAVWRIVAVETRADELWGDADFDAVRDAGYNARPWVAVLRPLGNVDSPLPNPRQDVSLSSRPGRAQWVSWQVYPTVHYPICAACHEPLPCREQMAERMAEAAANRMDRYSIAGVCPACQQPVTRRQKSLTWQDNLEVLGGPPVTFHTGRSECRDEAVEYDKRWVRADPGRRRASLFCAGRIVNHADNTYSCSEGAACLGPAASHRAYVTCNLCDTCIGRTDHGPRPGASAHRRGDDSEPTSTH